MDERAQNRPKINETEITTTKCFEMCGYSNITILPLLQILGCFEFSVFDLFHFFFFSSCKCAKKAYKRIIIVRTESQ